MARPAFSPRELLLNWVGTPDSESEQMTRPDASGVSPNQACYAQPHIPQADANAGHQGWILNSVSSLRSYTQEACRVARRGALRKHVWS